MFAPPAPSTLTLHRERSTTQQPASLSFQCFYKFFQYLLKEAQTTAGNIRTLPIQNINCQRNYRNNNIHFNSLKIQQFLKNSKLFHRAEVEDSDRGMDDKGEEKSARCKYLGARGTLNTCHHSQHKGGRGTISPCQGGERRVRPGLSHICPSTASLQNPS